MLVETEHATIIRVNIEINHAFSYLDAGFTQHGHEPCKDNML